jgi:hypothetical protein
MRGATAWVLAALLGATLVAAGCERGISIPPPPGPLSYANGGYTATPEKYSGTMQVAAGASVNTPVLTITDDVYPTSTDGYSAEIPQ